MKPLTTLSALALAAPLVLAENDGAFASQFKANLTTAAQAQLAAATAAENLINGNTTSQFSNNNGGKGDSSVSQDALTLDPSQVQVGAFIDVCATQQMLLANGVQTRGAPTCIGIVMGAMPSSNLIPTTAWSNPLNGANVKSQTSLNLQFRTTNMEFGNFVNAQANYLMAPQQLSNGGKIVGHSHISCNSINGLQDTTNVDFTDFIFFKGMNQVEFNGVQTATVAAGFPAGTYRCCTSTSAANHQPVLVSVAQRVFQDDCVRFTVSDDGDANQNVGDADAANQQLAQAAQQLAAFQASQAALAAGASTSSAGDNVQTTTTKMHDTNGGKTMTHHHHGGHHHNGMKSGGKKMSTHAKRQARREMRRSRQTV